MPAWCLPKVVLVVHQCNSWQGGFNKRYKRLSSKQFNSKQVSQNLKTPERWKLACLIETIWHLVWRMLGNIHVLHACKRFSDDDCIDLMLIHGFTKRIWVFPKIGVPPNHPFNRVFHEINHPFWGNKNLFLETPIWTVGLFTSCAAWLVISSDET